MNIGLYLKSIISTVANSVMGLAPRPIETSQKGQERGEVFGGGAVSPSP